MSVEGAAPEPVEPVEAVAVRVVMPSQLRDLARVRGEVVVEVAPPVTLPAVLDALEAAHPPLAGTIRDRTTGARRPMIRFYADGEDYSDAPATTVLPAGIVEGREPLRLVGSIAGG
jgi:sulfur-carrier protein